MQRIPASVAHVPSSLGVCAPPCRVVRRTTIRLEQPQSLSTRHTCVPRGRGPTARPISSTHGPEDSTPSDSALTRAIPASLHAPHDAPWAPHSTPRTPGTTSTSARPGPLHGTWRLPTITTGTPRGRCFAPLHEDLRTFFIIQVYIPVNVVKNKGAQSNAFFQPVNNNIC